MLKFGTLWKPDVIVILGDYGDFYSLSRFTKDPSKARLLQEEVEAVKTRLRELEKLFPSAEKVFIQGNHEARLETFINTRCPEIFGMLNTQALFELRSHGWKYVEYGKAYKLGKLYVTHGEIHRQNAAKAVITQWGGSVCMGHVHRVEMAIKVNAAGESHIGFIPGWLGDIKQAEYIKRGFADWMLGFGTCLVEPSKKGKFYPQIHPIIDYTVRYNDHVIQG